MRKIIIDTRYFKEDIFNSIKEAGKDDEVIIIGTASYEVPIGDVQTMLAAKAKIKFIIVDSDIIDYFIMMYYGMLLGEGSTVTFITGMENPDLFVKASSALGTERA